MAGWYLNAFLTTFRSAVDNTYPKRSKKSDGTIGDEAHARNPSEHNPDLDKSVDAWDMDVNLLGSKAETGTAAERDEVRKVLKEFQNQPQAQLWIYDHHIANRDIDNWRVRWYGGWDVGRNPHNQHAHLQSRPIKEKVPYPNERIVTATNAQPAKPPRVVGLAKVDLKAGSSGPLVQYLQRRLNAIFPAYSRLKEDGKYGAKTVAVIREFQRRSDLDDDGIIGPKTRARLKSYGINL